MAEGRHIFRVVLLIVETQNSESIAAIASVTFSKNEYWLL